MTTSRTAFLSEVIGDEPISAGKLAYFRRRLSSHVYALVVSEFLRLEKEGLITRADLARRIGRKPEQITRWFGSSGNWTLETVSDLLLSMKCEPSISIVNLALGEPLQSSNRRSDTGSVSRKWSPENLGIMQYIGVVDMVTSGSENIPTREPSHA